MMTRRFLQLAIVLGLITAVGPFAIDMYLPALPSIGGALHGTPAAVQMSLMVFFFTLGVCQLVYGPLSDLFGRKMPIYVGLQIFTIGRRWARVPAWWFLAPSYATFTPAMMQPSSCRF